MNIDNGEIFPFDDEIVKKLIPGTVVEVDLLKATPEQLETMHIKEDESPLGKQLASARKTREKTAKARFLDALNVHGAKFLVMDQEEEKLAEEFLMLTPEDQEKVIALMKEANQLKTAENREIHKKMRKRGKLK